MQELLRIISDSYKHFSSGQKKVAELFFDKPIVLAFSSALEVGRQVEVSESTVIRWTQKLGYRGYAEFQHVLQRKLAEERIEQVQEVSADSDGQSFLGKLLDSDIANIHKLKQVIDEETLLHAVDRISEAHKVYVTSNFFDEGLASWFSTWLNGALNHTDVLMPDQSTYYQSLSRLEQGDVMVALVFPRYTRAVLETLAMAKEKGAYIIILTDPDDSPAAAYADIALRVAVDSNLNIGSYTAVHALLTSLMRFIYVKQHAEVKANLEKAEVLFKERNVFL
ncbi:MurR/RpiR family transcriptional regulator [Planomicrobium sp. YIM 101495]|uniref:MurR/RpiR family transcriptional regulator n=1 Tax=Planomicrobium sp. YIM 101495 TaxID=2665160 RepID=UPI0012B81FEB|nr:MurR/RpiR family transcriptional regulator [Planomicrobium sp. YIM 101495]MTD31073.1 SIS domain-containing protein [Planomicrobium sp. YIM 101495]